MKISVIMPVYNAEKYLKEAIDSILEQTYSDFEFIIINDCSSDDSEEIIMSYDDERIVYLKNEENLGVARTLNKGLDAAKGEYIARMDSDDISLPDRFSVQIDFMESNRNIAVCGTSVQLFGSTNMLVRNSDNSKKSKIDLLFSSCLAHPSVMIRKSALNELNLRYDINFEKIEDYDLWVNLSRRYDICSIDKVLLKYRTHDKQVTQNYDDAVYSKLRNLKRRFLEELNINYSETELDSFCYISGKDIDKYLHFENLCKLFDLIYVANRDLHIYDNKILIKSFKNILFKKYKDIKSEDKFKVIKRVSFLSAFDLLFLKFSCK